jgi:hypothetical protein
MGNSTTHWLVACCEANPVLMASIKPTEMPMLSSKATSFRGRGEKVFMVCSGSIKGVAMDEL